MIEQGNGLFRIKALKNFNDVKKGDFGGLIESGKNLSQEGNCWIYDNAKVYGDAEVYGNAKVYDNAEVYGNCWIYDNAEVYGNIFDNEEEKEDTLLSNKLIEKIENYKTFDGKIFDTYEEAKQYIINDVL